MIPGVFWINTAIKLVSLYLISFGTGNLVYHMGVKINYTRKLNHFALFFIPMFLDRVLPYGKTINSFVVGGFLTLCTLIIYIRPVRTRFQTVRRMFLSFDRPEDRPYTLVWLSTQIIAGYLVIIPAAILFTFAGYSELIFIPVLINGIGDGLAEPVGIRFGRHKYQTKALFSKRTYERSIEGSACVFIASIALLVLFQSFFSNAEFIRAVIFLPIVMTFVEAVSPHTWDTPFIFFAGYTVLYVIKTIPQ